MGASYTVFKSWSASVKNNMLMPLKTSEPSGTSQSICARSFQNLTESLHRNPPEPHHVPASEPSGTSPAICTGTLRNLSRNLVLKLNWMASELIWAEDPIAKFCCWGKSATTHWPNKDLGCQICCLRSVAQTLIIQWKNVVGKTPNPSESTASS